MKPTIFVRPNLKLFLLGAVLILVVQHLITNGFSQGSTVPRLVVANAREKVDKGVDRILSQAGHAPASHIYAQLSDHYEAQGDFRKALRYLRLATLVAESEQDSD